MSIPFDYQNILPGQQLNSWEIDELEEHLSKIPSQLCQSVMAQIGIIWPVSHALCFAFLEELPQALSCLQPGQLSGWVRGVLDEYEKSGLRAARTFMADIERNYLCQFINNNGISFAQAQKQLGAYLHGLADRPLRLESDKTTWTNSETIFLEPSSASFPSRRENFLVYKLKLSIQWAFLHFDIHGLRHVNRTILAQRLKRDQHDCPAEENLLKSYLSSWPQPEKAEQVYLSLASIQATIFLARHLPGLMDDARFYFSTLSCPARSSMLGNLIAHHLHWLGAAPQVSEPEHAFASDLVPGVNAYTTLLNLFESSLLDDSDESRQTLASLYGSLDLDAASRTHLALRQEQNHHFISALALFLGEQHQHKIDLSNKDNHNSPATVTENGANISPTPSTEGSKEKAETVQDDISQFIRLDDDNLNLPDQLRELAHEIENDLGHVPTFYIDSAAKMAAGKGRLRSQDVRQEEGARFRQETSYDEWDFRRQGFRKNWCRLTQHEVNPVGGTFVVNTMNKYRGQIISLRRQFEMLRTQYRTLKHQRDGDDIDVDALVESWGDSRAGLSPSERLFCRKERDERDIAALFMVDMSSSTEGWVGTTIKEALILLSEALEAVSDPYAIYGFSGMRRSRCESFKIKDFSDKYDQKCQGKIAAITPQDYTRMGAAIRHGTTILHDIEVRSRLLIILTDGKPEDYDDYKGDYAIEDTRHALLESRAKGIHPFCITIDKEAQDYMAHMFGEINYTFIDDVKKLPTRVPEIYRLLTC